MKKPSTGAKTKSRSPPPPRPSTRRREIRDELSKRRLVVLDRFVEPVDCAAILMELEFTYWYSSAVVDRKSGRLESRVREGYRSSLSTQQMWFGPRLISRISELEERLAATFQVDPARFEPWQATRYERGERFDYHLDCGLWKRSRAGERVRTFLLYLDAPVRGGETHFRALGRKVPPRPGRLLVWNNLLPSGNCNHAMIHSGLRVEKGVKTTLVTWERERPTRKDRKR